MSEHIARIDASCYVLDCLWNMGMKNEKDVNNRRGRNVDENYEPFIRNLRAKRPDVPIAKAYGNAVKKALDLTKREKSKR